MRRRVAGVVLLLLLVLGVAATISVLTPSSPFVAQAAQGSDVYNHNCLSCHGGTGGPGVPGKTEPLEGARFVARNPTAMEIFDVVRSGREPSLRALTDDQVWASIAAELKANGVDLGDVRLGAATGAASLSGPGRVTDRTRFFPPGR